MRKKLVLLLIPIIFLALFFSPDCQATAGTVSGVIQEKEEEINALRERVRQKVEEKLKTIINKEKKRGWIGIVTEKSATGFKLKVKDEFRSVIIDEEVQIIGLKREKLTFEDLEIGQRLIAMGYLQPDNSLEAKRIVFLPEKEEKRVVKIIFGAIIDKSKEEELLVVAPAQNPDQEYEIVLNQKTGLRQRNNGKIEKINYKDFQAGQKIIALTSPLKNEGLTVTAKLVLLLSPSSSPTPSPQ